MSLPGRSRAGRAATRSVNAVSRRLGLGSGTVIGGRVGLALDPQLLERLAAGRPLALVSGTNGKTTTTRLLAEALGGPVVTNTTGSNMPAGHVAALAAGPEGVAAVLEVDEGYLPSLVASLAPRVVVLLNLSRDQLDRTNEVRMTAGRWRRALAEASRTTVVANADDPLVAWGAGSAPHVVWVGAGLGWRLDAVGCPTCEGRIDFSDRWACDCGFSRPVPAVEVAHHDGTTEAVFADAARLPVVLGVPGRFNRANAVMAAAAAEAMGVPAHTALLAMAGVSQVAGRFSTRRVAGHETRLMLAKNPAGWAELLELVGPGTGPVVVSINARVADGRDPSWLWDVAFEELRGRPVVAAGERCHDLAVRLRYAEVDHATVADPVAAVDTAARLSKEGTQAVEFIGNYTAFHDLLARAVSPATLRVVVVYPDLLGTYGDGGNGLVLSRRAAWRSIPVELTEATSDRPLPVADLYCVGGGEDGPQVRAAETLAADGTLARALEGGASVLAVCAGYQIAGTSFPDAQGRPREGLGLLDVTTVKSAGRRAVGEVLAEPLEGMPGGVLPTMTGFENHGGLTMVGSRATPLARVTAGVGNGSGDGTEGAWSGRVVGTYLHGPVLARNPALADRLLSWALDRPLEPLDDTEEQALRAERLGLVKKARPRWSPRGSAQARSS